MNLVLRRWAVRGSLAAAAFSALCAGQAFAQAGANHPDLSGYWELRDDSLNVSAASVTPQTAANAKAQEEHDVLARRWCNQLGMPAMMADRAPLDIRQSSKEVAMVAHSPSSARYIYTDGRKHPNKDEYDFTTNGHSVGHWEGDTFVADTVYFNDRGVTRLPGGGVRTSDSHLVERYRLLGNGDRLLVTFTWEDPKVFAKPHTYAYLYYRTANPGEPRVYSCISGDEERATFLTATPQPGNWVGK